jgi:hypothetical protein
MRDILIHLKNIIHEVGLITNSEFFKDRKNRKRLYASDPKSFLAVNNKTNVPVFPCRNQYGGVSISVLKRSLASAKRLHSKTGNSKYKDIIDQLEVYIKQLHNKALHYPINYKLNGQLKDILRKSRDLGSLSNIGETK